jgi:hypothetical protein
LVHLVGLLLLQELLVLHLVSLGLQARFVVVLEQKLKM